VTTREELGQSAFVELDLEGLSDRQVVDRLEARFDEVVEEVREGVEAISESAQAFAELDEDLGETTEERAAEEYNAFEEADKLWGALAPDPPIELDGGAASGRGAKGSITPPERREADDALRAVLEAAATSTGAQRAPVSERR
jgi:hypothetical protein